MTWNGVYILTKGKTKNSPIRVKRVVMGPTVIQVEPEDFLDLIAGKDLTIIRRTKGPFGWRREYHIYTYVAIGSSITFYTVSRKELTELQIDFITNNLSGW